METQKDLIECKCGCGELINHYDNQGRERRYKLYHFGKWMNDVWAEGRASPNSLKILKEMKRVSGRIPSEETRRKMSMARMGKSPWNKGMKNPFEITKEQREKISMANKGKIRTSEMRKRYSQSKMGRRLSNETKIKISSFQRGISTKEWDKFISREPYDQRWDNLFKNKIRQRDNQVCMLCGVHREKIKTALNVHHINYDKTISIPQNCISLCRQCHTKTNHNREGWVKFFQNIMNKRYNYIYNQEDNIVLNLETRK